MLRLSGSEVAGALELIRVQALKRGQRNHTFRETDVATLELLLPRGCGKDGKSRMFMESRLDVCAQELMDRIAREVGLKSFKVILNGKTLNAGLRLDRQGVGNHSKMMVLKVSSVAAAQSARHDADDASPSTSRDHSVQRTHRGFQILSERDGTEDPETAPFLEVADQKGNPLTIPREEKKALILAMGLHEKGRALMKRKLYDDALCHLLQADLHFSRCGSGLLGAVDNYGVLQLDVVWCYRALEALSCLEDGRERLRRAEDCFLRCYGERRQRLLSIKGSSGREEALFLRLHLLRSLLAFVDGDDPQARQQLDRAESLYAGLCPDADKMTELMLLGFSEREARLGLRACGGDLHEASMLIANQRQEREELRRREREKRQRTEAGLAILKEAGYAPRAAAAALRRADGDVERAFRILLDASQTIATPDTGEKVSQLLYLGFERSAAEAALALTGGDIHSATELLMDNGGSVPSATTPPSEEEEPGASSGSTDESELVNEVLEDIPSHEDDYLDLTLEEELLLINTIKTHLERTPAQ
ncbi:NEDD8 ultimate buster 1 isoform X2 [Corythoichthys intestinalis]|nr:NEDD8 ultimate buster 1 isoform X2 [Corythoichthys intestinalis]